MRSRDRATTRRASSYRATYHGLQFESKLASRPALLAWFLTGSRRPIVEVLSESEGNGSGVAADASRRLGRRPLPRLPLSPFRFHGTTTASRLRPRGRPAPRPALPPTAPPSAVTPRFAPPTPALPPRECRPGVVGLTLCFTRRRKVCRMTSNRATQGNTGFGIHARSNRRPEGVHIGSSLFYPTALHSRKFMLSQLTDSESSFPNLPASTQHCILQHGRLRVLLPHLCQLACCPTAHECRRPLGL